MADGEDHFSRLTDDLLRHILRFVTHKDGAVTTALSRRWRPLWTSSGAINFWARILEEEDEEEEDFFARRGEFISGAHAALEAFRNAADCMPIVNLSFRVEGYTGDIIRRFLEAEEDPNWPGRPNILTGLLSHRATRFVQDLRIIAVDNVRGHPLLESSEFEPGPEVVGLYTLTLGSLQSGTLRVLELTSCGGLAAPTVEKFPQLEVLRLHQCNLTLQALQQLVDAAPKLSSVLLRYNTLEGAGLQSLRFPAANLVLIDRCSFRGNGVLEINAPLLHYFHYKGEVRKIALSPPPQELVRAEISLLTFRRVQDKSNPSALRSYFWGFLGTFCHAQEPDLRVRSDSIELFAIEATDHILLPQLLSLQHVKLDCVYCPESRSAAIAITNLLRCCPFVEDLFIILTTVEENASRSPAYSSAYVRKKPETTFEESMDRFSRRWSLSDVAATEKKDKIFFDQVSELPELSHLECMNSVTTVRLEFWQGMKSLLGVQIVKCFIQNAKVLEKLWINDGNQHTGEHLVLKLQKWISRKWISGSPDIQILPFSSKKN